MDACRNSSSRHLPLLLLTGLPLAAQAPLPPQPHKPALALGAAWYPEQWPESRWDADLTLMEAAHINFVRVGEFAWSTMEPHEGDYQLDWLFRAVRLAEKHHIAVVIGTPTAAPPAWLTQKYPETLRTKEDGRKDEHGNRQQFDFSDPKYRELCRIIATKLAERFGHDPDVIGWQIDNEYANSSYGAARRRPLPAVGPGQVQDPRQPQHPLDHRLLERNLPGLEPDPHPRRRRQPRPQAQLEPVRLRHLAQLPGQPA